MTEKYIGRFAPSPTGPLHFGSLVAALASYLDAKAHHGTWLVRIEDVDETRCKPKFADEMLRTLQAFGLNWDGDVIVQSARIPAYEQALARLSEHRYTYACACSRKEIADSNSGSGLDGPVYAGTCRSNNYNYNNYDHHQHHGIQNAQNAQITQIAAISVRVLTNNEPITFTDRVQGVITQKIESEIGDFVVKRRDGLFAYQLAVVVDDAMQGVTHIVRGADLIDSTARQIHLQGLLGFSKPSYLHIPVALNHTGQKLSKQTLADAIIGNFRASETNAGITRQLILALSFLGQNTSQIDAKMSPSQLLIQATSQWQPTRIPRKPSIVLPA